MIQRAFTLIELLVVISILGLLASVVLLSMEGATDQAKQKKAMEFSHTTRVSLGADLVGEWRFDETAGTEAKDSSGYDNDGNLVGDPQWVDGIFGKALNFDGNDHVAIAHSSAFDLSQLTIELWIKTPSDFGGDGYRALVVKQGADRDYNFYARSYLDGTRTTHLHFSSARWGSSITLLPEPYDPNTWHHVAITVDSTGLEKYYSDGVFLEQHQRDPAVADNDYPLWIGKADNLWNGTIDEVRIYNHALPSAEIQQHYTQGIAKYGLALGY